jgi:hypothetical protein
MQAERLMLETDEQGNLIGLPKLPPSSRLEAIFLVLDGEPPRPSSRTPPARLKGSVTYVADPFEPALTDEEWEASVERTARQIAGDPEAFQ